MIDPVTSQRWIYRSLFIGLAGGFLFLRMLPLSTLPPRLPGPDLVLALTLAWVLRRPDFVPPLAIVAIFFLQDMLTLRAPGLWTLVALLGTEFLRDRSFAMRGLPFLAEWATVGALMAAMAVANRLVLAVVMVPQAGLGMTLLQWLTTLAAYPVVVAVSHLVFGLPATVRGGMDGLGGRA